MYFPLVRGRQFELLALKELVTNELIGDKIIPIIEPVKLSPTLVNTLDEFIAKKKKVIVIRNPSVGSFSDDWKEAKSSKKGAAYLGRFNEQISNTSVIQAAIIQKEAEKLLQSWSDENVDLTRTTTIFLNRDYIEVYDNFFNNITPMYAVFPDERFFSRKIRKTKSIILGDKFKKQEKNADYAKESDEFFSDDHLYYKEDGFEGFSDYSVIGADYMESGFAPFAVAIHIVYFDKERNLRIHHFVSKTNDDIYNPAGKYYEALEDLNVWYNKNRTNIFLTEGLKALLKNYENGSYPGLGTVKKLTIMHHMELMNTFLEGV